MTISTLHMYRGLTLAVALNAGAIHLAAGRDTLQNQWSYLDINRVFILTMRLQNLVAGRRSTPHSSVAKCVFAWCMGRFHGELFERTFL
jgi:hypothetical protein